MEGAKFTFGLILPKELQKFFIMNPKKAITSVVILLLVLGGVYAQESPTAAGGEAIGSGGTASYSIGQTVYTTITGMAGNSIAQGVQQPYEISTIVGVNETPINLELSVYPNPTASYLTLKIDNKTNNLSYRLYDVHGSTIEVHEIKSKATSISLEGQPAATYFLSVVKDNQVIKTFKIVKK